MKILFSGAEATPYAKSGGLADVLGALPVALRQLGHDVRLLLPRYGWIQRDGLQQYPRPVEVPLGSGRRLGALREDLRAPLPVYFLEHDAYFDRPWPYGPPGGAYDDNCARFSFLSAGTLAACRVLGFEPDVIHVHDWHTALTPVLLNTREQGPLARAATVLTIHNMGYQGRFPKEELRHTGLGWEHFTHLGLELFDDLCLLKGGILHATKITTVSPTYAREIQTPEGGFGLDGVARERAADLHGVINGIDTSIWNPATDPHLAARFGPDDLTGKAACKADLQRSLGLPVRPETPLLGLVTRITWQKGTDLLAEALEPLLGLDCQAVILGAGDPALEQILMQKARRQPDRLAVVLGYDESLAHRIEAGADLFLMPSRYEPCGLNQLYSQRYGTLPVVRATGGLLDTVVESEENGTGFIFQDPTPGALLAAVARAVQMYREEPDRFLARQIRSMRKTTGWDTAARSYEAIYEEAMASRTGRARPSPG